MPLVLGLLQFLPEIAHLFGNSTVNNVVDSPVAQKVLSIAQVVTGAATPDLAVSTIQGDPATALAFKKAVLDQQVTLEQIAASQVKAQTDVNLAEASSTNWFVAGWRPFVGWVCGVGLAYQFLFFPLLSKVLLISPLDSSELNQILFGMLGLGVMRTIEKAKDVSSNH